MEKIVELTGLADSSVLPFIMKILGFFKGYVLLTFLITVSVLFIYMAHALWRARSVYNSDAGAGELILLSFCEGIAWLARKAPFVLGGVLVLMLLNSALKFAGSVNEYIQNEKKIKEYTAVVKNLERSDVVARVSLYSETADKKTYLLELFAGSMDKASNQLIEMKGDEFWMDCVVVNFDYSQIGSGKETTVSYPYRVWSERVSPRNAYVLKAIPYIFEYGEDVYGIESSAYEKRLEELFNAIQDEKQARIMGIRSFNGNAVHFVVESGKKYLVKTLGTGGITVSPEENWDNQ